MSALMNNGLVLCLMIAVGFGSWPMIARFAGANNAWTSLLVMGFSALVCTFFYRAELAVIPTIKAIVVLALAGAVSGLGMIAYTRLVTDQSFAMSSYVPAALTLMLVFVTIVGALFFREFFPITKFLGLCLAVAGTWLMIK